jgi:hypothetical protein
MKPYAKHLVILEQIKHNHAARLLRQSQLHCDTGDLLDSAVLKIQKQHWSDHGTSQGIFFSVWLGKQDIEKGRFNYNIHALKLGFQKCCNVKPVAFARAFRRRFKTVGWPNISLDYGPQTLMQGWSPLDPLTFGQDVLDLIEHFIAVIPLIDELLAQPDSKT